MKKFFYLLFIVILISCSNETSVNSPNDIYSYGFDWERGVAPQKLPSNADREYIIKIAVDNNYNPEYDVTLTASLDGMGSENPIDFYDDGGLSPNSHDIVAANGIFTGIFNPNGLTEGEYTLKLTFKYFTGDELKEEVSDEKTVNVLPNSAPVIGSVNGINSGDNLEAGFSPFGVSVAVSDEDNEAGDSQVLTVSLKNGVNELKSFEVERASNLDNFVFTLDSTYAAGVATGTYDMDFIAKDSFDELSEVFTIDGLSIENTAPVIKDVILLDEQFTEIDTIFFPESATVDSLVFYTTVLPNDKQGHLNYQDIEEVELVVVINDTTNFVDSLRDDGNFLDSGDTVKNDGVYTVGFKYKYGGSLVAQPFSYTIKVTDKAGNESEVYNGMYIFMEKENLKIDKGSHEKINNNFISIN